MLPETALLSHVHRSVPDATRARARLHLLDWLGTAIAARNEPQALAFEKFAGLTGGTLIPGALALAGASEGDAAFLLGGLGNILEMDDLHNASILHAGNCVVPAALTSGVAAGADGKTVLDAIACGYEGAIRIASAAVAGGYTPFMLSTTCGVFGAAFAASRVHALDEAALRHALAQAAMMAGGVWQCRLEPGYAKQVASANATRCGSDASRLARAGLTGPGACLTGPLGFLAAYFPKADTSHLSAPSDDWKLHEVSFKPWPACRHTHPAIGAALALRSQFPDPAIRGLDIEQIIVRTYSAAIDFCDCPYPETDNEARFSLQHAVATALLHGAPRLTDFQAEARADKETSMLRDLVMLDDDGPRSGAFPKRLSAEVVVRTPDKEVSFACEEALGDPANPMSEAELIDKFHRNAAHGHLSRNAAQAIERQVMSLAEAPDLHHLAEAISSAFAHDGRARIAS